MMKKLLKLESIKLIKFRALWIIFLLYLTLSPILAYGFYNMLKTYLGAFLGDEWNPFAFPDVWPLVTYTSSWFNVLMGASVVIIMTNEYSFKTLKQHIIDGLSVKEVITAKFLVIFSISTIVTIYTFLVGLIYGLVNSKNIDQIWQGFSTIPIYYVQTLGYFCFAFLLATLFKKSALSTILFILSFLIEKIIGALLNYFSLEAIYAFFPLNAFSQLTPFPVLQATMKRAEEKMGNIPFLLDSWMNILLCLLYMSLFFIIAFWAIRRRDL